MLCSFFNYHFKISENQQSPFVFQSGRGSQDSHRSSRLKDFFLKHWFLFGLFFVIGLAAIWPFAMSKASPIHTEILVGYVCTAFIFLLSGMGLKSEVIGKALLHFKLIVFIQSFSLGFTPLVSFGLQEIFYLTELDRRLIAGIVIMCCVPTTIASNVLMTKQAGGNEAAAMINAVVGNILGVFASPALIIAIIGKNGSGNLAFDKIFFKLGLTVMAPIVAGQIIRKICEARVEYLKKKCT